MTIRPLAAACLAVALTFSAVPAAQAQLDDARPAAKAYELPSDERLEAAGLEVVRGRHIVLVSDAKKAPLDDLVNAFDSAYPLWLEYFNVKDTDPPPPPTTAFLVVEPARFQSVGLWDAKLPPFKFGYAFPDRIWLYDQPISDYFRRHLLLHEGVHAFMFSRFNGCGSTWYMEGTAELLATHQWYERRMKLPFFPREVQEVPSLGRLNTVRELTLDGKGLTIGDVMSLKPNLQGDNVLYGWCWAFAEFMDNHPRYRERFRALAKQADNPEFTALFMRDFKDDWGDLAEDWLVFTHDLEFNYDFARAEIVRKPIQAIRSGESVSIDADHGWQSTGVKLEGGETYTLAASGRFQIAEDKSNGRARPWQSEANGVSIRYYHGRPLGLLLGAIRPDVPRSATLGGPPSPLIDPIEIGLGRTIRVDQTGVLYLRVNDSAAELFDNKGTVDVKITRSRN